MPLSGHSDTLPKDTTFAPAALYARTRFSLVVESEVTWAHRAPLRELAFVTEKVSEGRGMCGVCGRRCCNRLLL
jgi:hypothetical protein